MIPKPFRLKLSKDKFQGQVKRGSFYLVIYRPEAVPQFAVRVSKKIDTRAVVRNRLRRQIVQWLFQHRAGLAPAAVLVVLKRKPNNQELSLLYDHLAQILSNH